MEDINDKLLIYQKLDKIEDKFEKKFDKLDSRVDDIDKKLAVYNQQLEIHIQGVITAREENKILREYIDSETTKIVDDIKPIGDHVQKLQTYASFTLKVCGWIVSLTAFAYLVLQILGVR